MVIASPLRGLAILIIAGALTVALRPAARATDGAPADAPNIGAPPAALSAKRVLDLTGRKRVGTASIYAAKFAGRKMADGTPMRPQADNAASLSLPLGTTARVTNLETGRTAIVTIRDRGPYARDRIVDLSPSTARQIGLAQSEGLAKVEIVPIAFPVPLTSGAKHIGRWDN